MTWLKDESLEDNDELPEPQDLAAEAITELEAVVDDLRELMSLIEKEEAVAMKEFRHGWILTQVGEIATNISYAFTAKSSFSANARNTFASPTSRTVMFMGSAPHCEIASIKEGCSGSDC